MPWDNTDGKQAPCCITLQRCLFAPFSASLYVKRGDRSVVRLPHTGLYACIVCTFLIKSLPRTECQLEIFHKRRGQTGMLNNQSALSWGTESIAKLERCWIAFRNTVYGTYCKNDIWQKFSSEYIFSGQQVGHVLFVRVFLYIWEFVLSCYN